MITSTYRILLFYYIFLAFRIQLFTLIRRNMKLLKFVLLRCNIIYWLVLINDQFYMLN